MLKGLPASGKSTYAKELVAKGWKRVNKDDLRLLIDNGKWSRANEERIREVETQLVNYFLSAGFNVVVDDTNFAYEDFWRSVAKLAGAEFKVKYFEVSVHKAVERDALRGEKSVGADVIWGMYRTYIEQVRPVPYVKGLTDTYIFDIDGTLALMNSRKPYDYERVGEDLVNEPVANVLDALVKAGNKIIIVSGREDSCLGLTRKWLNENDIHYDEIYMRKSGDKRKDSIVKGEIYDEFIKGKCNVMGVYDDRDQVVEFWRSVGLTCFQVAYGNF